MKNFQEQLVFHCTHTDGFNSTQNPSGEVHIFADFLDVYYILGRQYTLHPRLLPPIFLDQMLHYTLY